MRPTPGRSIARGAIARRTSRRSAHQSRAPTRSSSTSATLARASLSSIARAANATTAPGTCRRSRSSDHRAAPRPSNPNCCRHRHRKARHEPPYDPEPGPWTYRRRGLGQSTANLLRAGLARRCRRGRRPARALAWRRTESSTLSPGLHRAARTLRNSWGRHDRAAPRGSRGVSRPLAEHPATRVSQLRQEGAMIRLYHVHRRQGGRNPLGIGVIPAGAMFYLQPDWWWRDRYRGKPACRDPWIVEGFLNGTVAAARRNPLTGRWEDIYVARRSDFALLRSLRHGRRQVVCRARPDPARGRRSALRRRSLPGRSVRSHCPTVSENWLRRFKQRQIGSVDRPRRDDSAA